jgi:hypothetical protein
MAWPWLGNAEVYAVPAGGAELASITPFYWIDESKRKT